MSDEKTGPQNPDKAFRDEGAYTDVDKPSQAEGEDDAAHTGEGSYTDADIPQDK